MTGVLFSVDMMLLYMIVNGRYNFSVDMMLLNMIVNGRYTFQCRHDVVVYDCE